MKTVVLTGMMGVGKSTLGQQLARKRRFRYVDTDTVLEQQLGCPIAVFFENEGEPAFRAKEKELILATLKRPQPQVISLGGGAFLTPEVRQACLNQAYVIWLDAKPDFLWQRLAGDPQRPVLKRTPTLAAFSALMQDRQAAYAAAHSRVDTTNQSLDALMTQLLTIVPPQ